jgi:predicted O-methyltransferase YrrM|tara:strand:+ start:119 stop:706 length:588 start_codon:yes stop_codon:yes gene_type:complete
MDYEFTQDWFSEKNPEKVVLQFEEFLSEFKGKPCMFLEIGSFEGMSTIWMLENILTEERSQIFCIDVWAEWTEDAFVRFVSNINKTGFRDKVRIVKGDSSEELRIFPNNYFDFIYVDGNHDEKAVIKDAIGSFRVLKKGGIIAFDDYLLGIRYPNSYGSKAMNGSAKKAIDYFIETFKDELDVIHNDYQLWIRKR